MARTNLGTNQNTIAASNYSIPVLTPGPGRLALAFIANRRNTNAPAAAPAASRNGLAWTLVETGTFGAQNQWRITCFRAVEASPAPGPLLLDFGGQMQSGIAWSIFEYDGVEVLGLNGASAVLQSFFSIGNGTNITLALAPFGDAVNNLSVGGILLAVQTPVTPGGGFAEIGETGAAILGTLEAQDRTGEGRNVDWSWGSASLAGAIALELKAASVIIPEEPTDTPLDLLRRFEPILYFHPGESLFPCDAKRYLEHSALWTAELPFDKKDSWGGKGQPYDRKPLIEHGKIAADKSEVRAGDTYLGSAPNLLTDKQGEERFLELSGWKDKAGVYQPKVTAISANTNTNRMAMEVLYNVTAPDLKDSRFWYHGEVYDTKRLERLMRQQAFRAPDFAKIFESLRNAALVCYYFFFPAHEERLGPPCDTLVEGIEFGAFGGEWACVALLLERDDPAVPYTVPSWIGHTGRRAPDLALSPGMTVPVPQAFDAERRSNMKVTRWRPGTGSFASLPDGIGLHPKLFVSLGTHSLYLEMGAHAVDAYPSDIAPQQCGRFDTPEGQQAYEDAHPHEDPDGNAWVALLKTMLGLAAFGLGGAVAGGYWAHLEGNEFAQGLDVVGAAPAGAPPAPDQGPAPGDLGWVVHPTTVTISDDGAQPQPWAAAQDVEANGRRYNLLVDRSSQVWWPSDDGQSGFRGRWGPRVEDDPVPRRAGMRFPEFWRMFFEAFAKAKATPGPWNG